MLTTENTVALVFNKDTRSKEVFFRHWYETSWVPGTGQYPCTIGLNDEVYHQLGEPMSIEVTVKVAD